MSAYRQHMMPAVVVASLFAPAPALAAFPEDLAANDVRFKETIARLEPVKNGTQAEKCTAYRSHVEIMQHAIPIFDRCTTGRGRQENIGQMNDSIEDFQALIKARCGR